MYRCKIFKRYPFPNEVCKTEEKKKKRNNPRTTSTVSGVVGKRTPPPILRRSVDWYNLLEGSLTIYQNSNSASLAQQSHLWDLSLRNPKWAYKNP